MEGEIYILDARFLLFFEIRWFEVSKMFLSLLNIMVL